MVNGTWEGFIGVVGKVDGTDIVSGFKPRGEFKGELFYNRKNRYALDLCAVCDSDKKFTYILAGWPNSQHDARIFGSTNLQQNPQKYFSDGRYLLSDAAYTNSLYMVAPYKAPTTYQKEKKSLIENFQAFESISNMHLEC